MGLDTLLFAIRKPTEEELNWIRNNELSDVKKTGRYLVFDQDRVAKEPQLYVDMKPYWEPIVTTELQFDWMRCLAEHGVNADDDLAFSGRTKETISLGFASGAEITMTIQEYESYIVTDISSAYVIAKDDVARMRNNWDALETLSDMRTSRQITQYINAGKYDELKNPHNFGIHNCGYYIIDEEEKEVLKNDEDSGVDSTIDNKTIALYAWW